MRTFAPGVYKSVRCVSSFGAESLYTTRKQCDKLKKIINGQHIGVRLFIYYNLLRTLDDDPLSPSYCSRFIGSFSNSHHSKLDGRK